MSELKGKTVLVTGATGFVGSFLTKRLLEIGANTRILVRTTADSATVKELVGAGAEVVYGDVVDRKSVFEAVKGSDCVFHIAALFRQAKFPDEVYYHVNVDGVRNVFDAAKEAGVGRLLHCSTVGVHSHIPSPPAAEDEPYRPGDIYQHTKCEGEKLALEYIKKGEIDAVVVRPAMIWGEGDKRMLKLFRGVSKKRFPIVGSGKTLTHWIYVRDLVEGMILAATAPSAVGQIYIIAGKRAVSISELVSTIAKKAGVKPLPFKIPAVPVQLLGSLTELVCKPFGIEPPIYRRRVDFFTKDRSFDTTKAERELGFVPRYDFEEEVERIYSWYSEQGWLN